MQGHDFIFFLQDKQHRFWQLDDSGNVTISANPYPLDFSPDGWQDTGIQNILNKKYWSIDRTVTIPFKYVEDGAKILKHIFYTKGVEESVYLVICEQRLAWDPLPSALLTVLTGTNPFSAGTNTGTITGTPGDTVYVKVTFAGDPLTDFITGNIGGGVFVNINTPGSTVFPVVLPPSGVANYNIFLDNTSTTASAQMQLSTSAGLTTPQYGYWYKQTFRSEVDLSTFNHDGPYVTCNNTEEGFAKHLKANENTVYEIPLEDLVVKDDGIDLKMRQPWGILTDYVFDQTTFPFEIALPLAKLTSDGLAPYIAFFDENLETFKIDNDPFKYAVGSQNFFEKVAPNAPVPITANFGGKLRVKITTQRTVRQFKLYLWHVPLGATPTTPGMRIEVWNTGLMTAGVVNEFDFSTIGPIVSDPSDRFFFMWDRNPGGSPSDLSDYQFEEGSELSLTFTSRFATTYVKADRPQTVFSELINKMTAGEYSAEVSPYLGETQNFDKVFTSGDGLRSIEGAVLKISFAQYVGFWNTYDEVGIQERTGKKILLGRKADLVDPINVIDLGQISKPRVALDKDFPYNELAIGYPDVKNEQGLVNGKNEFNTTSVFSLGTTKTPRKYEKISQVQASCYAQESIRIEQAQQDTTDNRSDNDPFVMHIERDIMAGSGDIPDHYNLDRSLNPFLLGVESKETIYNVLLSPKRCVDRSADFLRSALYLADNKILKFITSDRNKDMEYINGSDIVIEKADVPVGDLNPKFFYPVIITIDTIAPESLLDDLDAIPGRCFQFTFNGDVYKGIAIKNSISPSSRKSQTYDLLSLASNDLTPLIDFYGE